MSLESWRESGWLLAHRTSRQEIADLLALADRDLKDCCSEGLSADWRFNIAYNALLQSATAALAAAGYRASHESHHYRVLRSLGLTVGLTPATLRQLDAFRKKRNLAGYERIGAVSDQEVREVAAAAAALRQQVESWIRQTRPDLF